MADITISSFPELQYLASRASNYPEGTVVQVSGEFSQTLSKGYNAYYKAKGQGMMARVGGVGAAVALCFGPVGWAFAAASTIGMVASIKQQERITEAFNTLPCSEEIERLAYNGFKMLTNNGSCVILKKQK